MSSVEIVLRTTPRCHSNTSSAQSECAVAASTPCVVTSAMAARKHWLPIDEWPPWQPLDAEPGLLGTDFSHGGPRAAAMATDSLLWKSCFVVNGNHASVAMVKKGKKAHLLDYDFQDGRVPVMEMLLTAWWSLAACSYEMEGGCHVLYVRWLHTHNMQSWYGTSL